MFAPSKGSTSSNAVDVPMNRVARDAAMNFMVFRMFFESVMWWGELKTKQG